MKRGLTIFRRETLSYFVSPVAYFVITGFVMLAAYFFFRFLQQYNFYVVMASRSPYGAPDIANLNQAVVEGFFHTLLIILVFLVPFITMRSFAEEKRRGTFELLVTSPISVFEIVIGKFLGVALVLFFMIALASAYPVLLWCFGDPGPELLPVLGGALGLYLCALGFAAIGLAISAMTENQVVAGVLGMVVLLLLYAAYSPAEPGAGGQLTVATVLNYLSPVQQVADMFKGVISLKSVVYFLSLIATGLFLSQRALEAYRWR
jgi:ABC-2 type transport system permease protein